MSIEIRHNEKLDRFEALTGEGKHVGEIEYRFDGDGNMEATHTGVLAEFEGQGIAARLLEALVQYAASNGLKIIPVCPYIAAVFEKSPDRYAAVTK